MPSERSSRRFDYEVGDKDGDQKHHRRHRDHLSSETPTNDGKTEVNEGFDRKGSEPGEDIKLPDPTTVPRSRSYFQHDDRGIAAHDGRRSGRRDTAECGFWKDYKDDERVNCKAGSDVHEKDRKSIPRGDGYVWRHDRFSEVNTDAYPPAKKRRHFREEKLPDPELPNKAPNAVTSTMGSERREERGRDRRPLERSEQDRAYGRQRSLSTRARDERDGFNGGEYGGGKYRGRDRFGGRQGYRGGGGGASGGQVEKWKHDMYDDADSSSVTPKNEEDPVAKVEALLAL